MTGFESFAIFNALKLHFTQNSYDYQKYQGKTRVTIDSFENRKDKYFFYKLSRKFVDKSEYELFLVANFIDNPKIWVGKLLDEESLNKFRERQKVLQSLSYQFKTDCETLFGDQKDPNSVLQTGGDYPILLTRVLQHDIMIETLIILNGVLNFFPCWERKITDTVRWPDFKMLCQKYEPFIGYDKEIFRNLLKQSLG